MPIAYFLAIMLTIVLEYDCMESGYAALMSFSSAGARSNPPPQTKQVLCFLTNSSICFFEKEISISTLTHSPVAAGVVIALENVFGILIPSDVNSGIMIIVVSLPGTPHIQCLSATTPGKWSISPVWAMAFAMMYNS